MNFQFQVRKRCTLYGIPNEKKDAYSNLHLKYTLDNNLYFITPSPSDLKLLVDKLSTIGFGKLDCNLYQGEITRKPQFNEFQNTIDSDEFYKKCVEKKELLIEKESKVPSSDIAQILEKLESVKLEASTNRKRKNRKKNKNKVKKIAQRN
eukprot:NODE_12_length_54577_cov_0.384100.p27 type:complete len:150 gc:universal NODE_12_length_54577_cov_0.384100:30510-30061(-)